MSRPSPGEWAQAIERHLANKPRQGDLSVQEFEQALQTWERLLIDGARRASADGMSFAIPEGCAIDSEYGLIRIVRKGE